MRFSDVPLECNLFISQLFWPSVDLEFKNVWLFLLSNILSNGIIFVIFSALRE